MSEADLPPRGERLAGRTSLVLGAGSVAEGWGNGRAISVLFARQGSRVVCVDRDEAALEATCALVREAGGEVMSRVADVMDEAALQDVVQATEQRFGGLDVLVNNVGGSLPGGPCELSPTEWDAQMNLNLRYVYLALRVALPVMERLGGGSIINMGSIAGLRHLGFEAVGYATTKAALVQLSRSVAVQYAPVGIRCNCVIPGLMNTPLVTHRLAYQAGNKSMADLLEARGRRPPLGRMGDAWDVAYAALFLACDESKYVTATELLVDGGLAATSR